VKYRIIHLLVALMLLISWNSYSQIYVSEQIQPSQLSETTDNNLYFIDFWATWCVPCVYAKKYLGVLQSQNPRGFYVASISNEQPDVIRRYLKKHPTDLPIYADYNSHTFNKYEHQYLPYGVLLDGSGRVLWEGSPTDFTQRDLDRYKRQAKRSTSVNDFFQFRNEVASEQHHKKVVKDMEVVLLDGNYDFASVMQYEGYVAYEGSLRHIFSKLMHVSPSQIVLTEGMDAGFEIKVPKNQTVEETKQELLNYFDLEVKERLSQGKVLVFRLSTPNFWDTSQIEWGEGAQSFLVGDSELMADNVSFGEVALKLSNLLELPVLIEGYYDKNALHDWQIHYKFFDLMRSNLKDYGVDVTIENNTYSTYYIELKKAP